jgi:hypothetical protein
MIENKKLMKKKINYQDFVIKNGKFIGQFEKMYQEFKDPWNLLNENQKAKSIIHELIYFFCNKIRNETKKKLKTIEIGCGYPIISNSLHNLGFTSYGTDISKTVINRSKKMKNFQKLKKKLFVSKFLNFKLYDKLNADIYIMSEISWYVLPFIKSFLNYLRSKKNVYLIHSLTVYKKNNQSYGKEYFYDLKSIKNYFDLNYICSINIDYENGNKNAFFIAKI